MGVLKKNHKKIGVLGGTFDRQHVGDLEISKYAIKKMMKKFKSGVDYYYDICNIIVNSLIFYSFIIVN